MSRSNDGFVTVLVDFGRTRVLCTASLEDRVPPWLRGTFYDDNVFFEFDDQQQEHAVRPLILELAEGLPVRVIEY